MVIAATALSITVFAGSNQIGGYINGKQWTARHVVDSTYADCTILYDGNSDVSVRMITAYREIGTNPFNYDIQSDRAYKCAGCTFSLGFGWKITSSSATVLVINGGTSQTINTTP